MSQQSTLGGGVLSGLSKEQTRAFKYCSECKKVDGSTFHVKCSICGWAGKTNANRMQQRHYLQLSEDHNGSKLYGQKCKPLSELEQSHPSHINELRVAFKAAAAKKSKKRAAPASGSVVLGSGRNECGGAIPECLSFKRLARNSLLELQRHHAVNSIGQTLMMSLARGELGTAMIGKQC